MRHPAVHHQCGAHHVVASAGCKVDCRTGHIVVYAHAAYRDVFGHFVAMVAGIAVGYVAHGLAPTPEAAKEIAGYFNPIFSQKQANLV